MEAQPRHYPTADQRPNDPDGDITNQAKSGAVNNFTREPTRNETYKQNDEETFARDMHWLILSLHRTIDIHFLLSDKWHGNNLFQRFTDVVTGLSGISRSAYHYPARSK